MRKSRDYSGGDKSFDQPLKTDLTHGEINKIFKTINDDNDDYVTFTELSTRLNSYLWVRLRYISKIRI